MGAPDKIFIDEDLITFHVLQTKYDGDIEYIRKDALLEWLENKIKVPDVGFINGLTYLAYQDVIEHLNEM